jgi:hypothetical protein
MAEPNDDKDLESSTGAAPELLPQHWRDLHKSGISREQVAAAGIYSLNDPHQAKDLLGWKYSAAKLGPFLAFPFPEPATGRVTGFFRLKPDRPRKSKGETVKYESPIGKGNRAYFPPRTLRALDDPSAEWLVTEGEKKALKADQEAFLCIGLTGVESWSKKRQKVDAKAVGGRELIDDLASLRWDGRKTYIAFDSDIAEKESVQRAEWALAEALREKGAVVRVIRIPPGPPGPDGKPTKQGLDDFLVAQGAEALRKLLDSAKAPAPPEDKRPKIFLCPDEHRVVEQTVKALGDGDPHIYQRGNELVRVIRSARPPGRLTLPESPRIDPIPLPNLRLRMTSAARYMILEQKGDKIVETRVAPPEKIVKGVGSLGQFLGVRPLEAVVEAPVLRRDGSVVQTAGYDPATGLLYVPVTTFPQIPETVSHANAIASVELLLDAVCDFPFKSAEHRSVWIAGVLTMVGRFAFEGPAPLFLVDGNVRACGKGLLADLAAVIALGRDFAKASNTTDDDEMRKVILSIALAGERAILLDNIGGALGTPSLDAALTSVEWQGRILKTNDVPRVPLVATWWGTGNNVTLLADTARRICHVRLESPLEKPEERTDLKRPELLSWARANRGKLLAAALTILSGYIQAGKPRHGLKPWGSYEGWSGLVREAVVWAGLPDPGLTRQELAEAADRDGNALRALLAGWEELDPNGKGLTVAAALRILAPTKDCPNPATYPTMRAALADLVECPHGQLPPGRKVGNKLRTFRGRFAGGKYFDAEVARGGVLSWKVRQVSAESGGTGGTGGTAPYTSTREKTDNPSSNHSYGAGADVPPVPPVPPDPLAWDVASAHVSLAAVRQGVETALSDEVLTQSKRDVLTVFLSTAEGYHTARDTLLFGAAEDLAKMIARWRRTPQR